MRSYVHMAMKCVCVWIGYTPSVPNTLIKEVGKRKRGTKQKETEKEVAVNRIDQYFSLSLHFYVQPPNESLYRVVGWRC